MSKVLITGALGQLGTDLLKRFETEHQHEVVAIDRDELDITDRSATLALFGEVQPQIVIHCAAYTAVDNCESNVDLAFAVNAFGSRNIAEASHREGAHLVAVSTDYVFDGKLGRPIHEWDVPNPVSVYGKTKLAGEMEIRDICPTAAIARTAWVCGPHGANMLKTVMRLLSESDQTLSFVDDQWGIPTFTDDLAEALYKLAVSRAPGTFHLTNTGPDEGETATTWYRFVCEIAEQGGFGSGRVVAISTSDLNPPRPAPRPPYSVLAPKSWRNAGFTDLPDWRLSLGRNIKRYLDLS